MKKPSTEHETGKIRTGDLKLESGNWKRPASLREMLHFGEEYLAGHDIADAAVDAWLLLEYVTGLSRAQYLTRAAEPLDEFCEDLRTGKRPDKFCGALRMEKKPKDGAESETTESADRSCGSEHASAEALIRRYQELLERRSRRIPLQHLTGEQEFMGLPFLVNEHVLIPRQDTETLVEEALARLRPGMHVLDLCTGSGCIAVSLAKLGPEYLARKAASDKINGIVERSGSAKAAENKTGDKKNDIVDRQLCVDASDISPEALAVARENARRLGAQVRFIESDLFAGIDKVIDTAKTEEMDETDGAAGAGEFDGMGETTDYRHGSYGIGVDAAGSDGVDEASNIIETGEAAGRYDMIVSNPPYIRTAVIAELSEEVRLHEPRLALDGAEDGLHFYREIVRQSPAHLTDGGRLIFEIGYDQAEAVRELMEKAGFGEIRVIRDLAGHDRVVVGRWIGRG